MATTLVGITAVNNNSLPRVMLAVIVLLTLAAFEAVTNFPTAVIAYLKLSGSASRINEILETSPQATEPNTGINNMVNEQMALELERVSAGWLRDQDNIRDFSLQISPGQHVGIVGQSGTGKSTLAALILRQILPTQGTYSVNGIDIERISWEQMHGEVIGVGVDAHIFATTVRENLTFAWMNLANRPTDEDLVGALELAELGEWLATLESGLETQIHQHGSNMSAGQKQRLRLARMFLANPDVWVLDEPVEFLNEALASVVMKNIKECTQDRSLVLLTHRVCDVLDCDQITIMEIGSILEQDRPQELLSSDAKFSTLVEIEESATRRLLRKSTDS